MRDTLKTNITTTQREIQALVLNVLDGLGRHPDDLYRKPEDNLVDGLAGVGLWPPAHKFHTISVANVYYALRSLGSHTITELHENSGGVMGAMEGMKVEGATAD
ncbi:hypothetical protein N0V88_007275 [Collariella sp. IMI 366227]|nr:hypothetical protein N0V88_007275 [Collariella sp. IMI 366227]